jgi:hypothetical protein
MPDTQSIQNLNLELARKINDEVRTNPASPYAGKIVGLANGQVVSISDNWDDMAVKLRKAEPDPSKTYCFEAGAEYEVEEIWELR